MSLKQIKDTLAKDTSQTKEEAYADVYRRIRDGEVASADALIEYFEAVFFPKGSFKYNTSIIFKLKLIIETRG